MPWIGLLGLASYVVFQQVQVLDDTSHRAELVKVVQAASDLAHELQRERGHASALLGSGGASHRVELETQRRITDGRLRVFLETLDRPVRPAGTSELRAALAQLPNHRRLIDEAALDLIGLLDSWQAMLDPLLRLADQLADEPHVSELGHAYADLLQFKERVGQERAVGSYGFASGRFDLAAAARLIEIQAQQALYLDAFRNRAAAEAQVYHGVIVSAGIPSEIERLRALAAAGRWRPEDMQTGVGEWFQLQSERVDLLKTVEDQLAGRLSAAIDDLAIEARHRLMWLVAIVVALVGLTIEAWRRSEVRAERADERLARAMENISEGFVLWDESDRLALCNQRYRSFFGGIEERVSPGATFAELAGAMAERGLVSTGGAPDFWLQRRLRMHRLGAGTMEQHVGDGRWLLISERRLGSGERVGLYTDITELKHRESALTASRQRLACILDNLGEGIVIAGENDIVETFNRAAESIFVRSAAEVVGRPLEELLPFLPAMAASDVPVRTDAVEIVRPNGTAVALEITMTTLVLGDERLRLNVLHDVTARTQAEAAIAAARDAAELANRAKTEFLAAMSHELRTPLNAIIGFSEVIRDEVLGPLGDGRYKGYARDVHAAGTHLLDLINDILDVARIEAGKVTLYEEEVLLPAVVEAALRMVRDRAERSEVAVAAEIAEALPPIRADERRLKQILVNLLSNAVKFTPPEGRVRVAARLDEDGWCVIEVADNGIGMSADEVKLAMTPFTQVDSRLARRYEGTGLGLPLTRGLVDLHGGTMAVSSRPGAGTTVTVRLPPARILAVQG